MKEAGRNACGCSVPCRCHAVPCQIAMPLTSSSTTRPFPKNWLLTAAPAPATFQTVKIRPDCRRQVASPSLAGAAKGIVPAHWPPAVPTGTRGFNPGA